MKTVGQVKAEIEAKLKAGKITAEQADKLKFMLAEYALKKARGG